jgi:hypothetical protein
MIHDGGPPERRDDLAADRDDLADRRDSAAADRDTAAHQRDVQADDLDEQSNRNADDLHDRLTRIRRQLLARLARLENTSVDPDDWPELTRAGLARLRAHAAEQRHLAALDRAAINELLDDLRSAIGHSRSGRFAATQDRRAAREDRHAAAQNRVDAAGNRDDSAQDRDQTAIERQQPDPADLARVMQEAEHSPSWSTDSLVDQVARAVADSRRRIADSRTYLARPVETGPNNRTGRTARDATPDPPDG